MDSEIRCSDIKAQRVGLEGVLRALDPERLDGSAAVRVLRELAQLKHVVAQAEGRVARRVDESRVWTRKGTKSAAQFVAKVTGTSVGTAATVLETAERLESLPVTAQAYATGRLSSVQAATIANAAIEVPDAEHELVTTAIDAPFASLRDHAQRVKARGTDLLERDRRIHAQRQLREWTDGGGAWHLSATGTGTDGARIMASLKTEAGAVFTEARRAGEREPQEAYAFDALVRLTTRDASSGAATSGPRAHVHVNVDAAALLATTGLPGATCEIPGIGPIPVQQAQRLLGDALLTVLVRKGVDVTTVAHHGRTIPTAVRRALEARDPECVIDGCPCRDNLEHHHLERWADTHETTLEGCVRVCPFHHDLITYDGYTLEALGDGTWALVAPATGERGPP
jgi:Domain of unknown function (DUF222)